LLSPAFLAACFVPAVALVVLMAPVNILVMGPGGCRFMDYFRAGGLLTLFVLPVIMFVLPVLWALSPQAGQKILLSRTKTTSTK